MKLVEDAIGTKEFRKREKQVWKEVWSEIERDYHLRPELLDKALTGRMARTQIEKARRSR
jgi:hypothetical protein